MHSVSASCTSIQLMLLCDHPGVKRCPFLLAKDRTNEWTRHHVIHTTYWWQLGLILATAGAISSPRSRVFEPTVECPIPFSNKCIVPDLSLQFSFGCALWRVTRPSNQSLHLLPRRLPIPIGLPYAELAPFFSSGSWTCQLEYSNFDLHDLMKDTNTLRNLWSPLRLAYPWRRASHNNPGFLHVRDAIEERIFLPVLLGIDQIRIRWVGWNTARHGNLRIAEVIIKRK